MAKYVNPLDPPYVAPVVEAPVEANPVADAPAPTSPIPSDEDISTMAELLSALSPADIDRLRLASSANPDLSLMLAVSNGDSNIKRLPDGSIQATITLSPDVVEPLTVWAEAAGQTLGQQIQEVAGIAISSYLYQDWAAMATPPTPPVAAAVTPPVVVPPAVAK